MVMVAAVALSSATYAWFVSNNSVKATTSEISAQSNSAFMVIKYDATAVGRDLTADVATLGKTALFPAQWKNNFDSNGKKSGTEGADAAIYQFETAFGTNPTSTGYAMEADTLKAVGNPAAAVTGKYAVKNVFNISSKGSALTDLKVAGVSIIQTDDPERDDNGNEKLDTALRVLVVCGNSWVVCDKDGIVQSSNTSVAGDLGTSVAKDADTEVDLYVYYDGNDSEIYSNNLVNLQDASTKITVEFTATPPTN